MLAILRKSILPNVLSCTQYCGLCHDRIDLRRYSSRISTGPLPASSRVSQLPMINTAASVKAMLAKAEEQVAFHPRMSELPVDPIMTVEPMREKEPHLYPPRLAQK